MSQLVVIIQCDIVSKRCSGYACTNAFYNREGTFEGYAPDTRYMTLTCGGCCGAALAAKLEHLLRKVRKYEDQKENIVIHLASCICSDNYHRPPCPHLDYIKAIVERKGYPVVLGSYISKKTAHKRETGQYTSF